jgi:hypothetical protein
MKKAYHSARPIPGVDVADLRRKIWHFPPMLLSTNYIPMLLSIFENLSTVVSQKCQFLNQFFAKIFLK